MSGVHYDVVAFRADLERRFAWLLDEAERRERNSDDAAYLRQQSRLAPIVIDIACSELEARNAEQTKFYGRALGLMLGQALYGLRRSDAEQFGEAITTMMKVMNGHVPSDAVMAFAEAQAQPGGHA